MKTEANIKSYLIEKRHIPEDTITKLEDELLIMCSDSELSISMKNLD
jgi:hypothetical protein